MTEIVVTKRKDKNHISVNGDLTIGYAQEFKKAIKQALKGVKEIVIEMKNIETIDTACLQLFCAAHISAGKNKKIILKDIEKSPVLQTAMDAGFLNVIGCQDRVTGTCFWKGGSE